MNRKVALDLTQIADVADRVERLNLALDFATQRKEAEKAEAVAALEKAEDDLEVAEAEEVGYRLLGDAEHEAEAAKRGLKRLTKGLRPRRMRLLRQAPQLKPN